MKQKWIQGKISHPVIFQGLWGIIALCVGWLSFQAFYDYEPKSFMLVVSSLILPFVSITLLYMYVRGYTLSQKNKLNQRAGAQNIKTWGFRLQRLIGPGILVLGLLLIALTRALPDLGMAGVILLVGFQILRLSMGLAFQGEGALEGTKPNQKEPSKPKAKLEGIAGLISAVMVLLLVYHFALEAFRIPTGSMEPTLYGHPILGDRALVNKLSYKFHDPGRGDIAVFRFPLARPMPYVKRVAGMPGELVLVASGDVYTQAEDQPYPEIWRKTGGVRDSLWLPFYDFEGGTASLKRDFKEESGKNHAQMGVLQLEPEASQDQKTQPARLRFPKEGWLRDHNPKGDEASQSLYGHEFVQDIRLTLEVSRSAEDQFDFSMTCIRGKTQVSYQHRGAEAFLRVDLPWSEEALKWEIHKLQGGEELKSFFEQSQEYQFSFGVADGAVDLEVNGQRLERVFFETPVQRFMRMRYEKQESLKLRDWKVMRELTEFLEAPKSSLELTSLEPLEIRNFSLARDVYYVGRMRYQKVGEPEGHYYWRSPGPSMPYAWKLSEQGYFMLGDNSQNSLDSRQWHQLTIKTLKGESCHFQATDILAFAKNKRGVDAPSFWNAQIQNVVLGVNAKDQREYERNLKQLEASLFSAFQAGDFGFTFVMKDIYGIKRKLSVANIEALSLSHQPEVQRNLVEGQLQASLFPHPRFVD